MAQHLRSGDSSESFRGSPLYMVCMCVSVCCDINLCVLYFQAPEIMLGQSYDAKVDLWSVGVILYGMLFLYLWCGLELRLSM